jgi:hypothetical protein
MEQKKIIPRRASMKRLICMVFVLFATICLQPSLAQPQTPQELRVFKNAQNEVQAILTQLLTEDPFLAQIQRGIQMREAKAKINDVLPNPELGVNWSPIPMQKALNQTLAIRGMQPFPWPGTIRSSVELEQIQVELERLKWLQQSNERMVQIQLLLLERERMVKQTTQLEKQLRWLESIHRDLETRLTFENVRKSVLELEIEEHLLLQKREEWKQLIANNEAEIQAYFTSNIVLPDSLYFDSKLMVFSENHPLLESAIIKEKLGHTRKKIADFEGKPMFALGAEYMWIQEAMPIMAPEMQMQPAFTIMASINLPVYRKKIAGMKAEAHQTEKMAEYEYEAIKEKLNAKFQIIIEQKKFKQKELALAETIIPEKLKEMSALEREKWQTGSGTITSWIQIERRLLEQESAAINARIDLKKLDVELAGLVAWEN